MKKLATALARVEIASAAEWRAWLAANHRQGDGVWLVTWKKGSGGPHVPQEAAVEEALCFGWIDSRPARLDDRRSMVLFSPRKPDSGWSAINKRRIGKLIAEGRMDQAGLAVLEAAKASRAWHAFDAAEALAMPDDLAAAFAREPMAAKHFAAFPPSVQKAILQWIGTAKRPETRAARVADTVRKAAQNVRANQWRQRAPRE
jgi:uncharacterized protein YdeI (YjbR/CyaY-like superfamily)